MIYSIKNKDGNDLDKSKYVIDFEKKTFYSREKDLVIDFSGLDGWSFKTRYCCKFKTGNNCKFYTRSYCEFKTGNNCKFDTLCDCTFKTGNNCKFDISYNCIFNIGNNCELKFNGKQYKLNKGFSFVNDEYKLHRDIDENLALLNTKHEDEFVRDVCKFVLKGDYHV